VCSAKKSRPTARLEGALQEFVILSLLYVAYTVSRMLADGNLAQALGRATDRERVERALHLPKEQWLNELATVHEPLGLVADYWYASLHYVVTAGVLLWLYRRGRRTYIPARRALALATLIALAFYLMMPTAPPRMVTGFTDVMAVHAGAGWWGAEASAPRGLGGHTNQLAAFPSMHAGWALWVALAVWRASRSRTLRTLAALYAVGTGIVVVATGNHWVLDVIVGQAVMLLAWIGVVGPVEVAQPTAPARLDDEPSISHVEAA
jgi:membrane-associated phospholipid phosphatase